MGLTPANVTGANREHTSSCVGQMTNNLDKPRRMNFSMIDVKKFKPLQWAASLAIVANIYSIVVLFLGDELSTSWFLAAIIIVTLFLCIFAVRWPKKWWPDDRAQWPRSLSDERALRAKLCASDEQKTLRIAHSIEHATIDKITAMNDAKPAMAVLSGRLEPPT